jgi:uncharacterized protein
MSSPSAAAMPAPTKAATATAAATTIDATGPLLGRGEVRHLRLRPRLNGFVYPTCFLMLPMRAMRGASSAATSSSIDSLGRAKAAAPSALARNRFAPLSFYDRDHGDGGGDALAWIETLLRHEGVDDVSGEIWLQTYPRLFGHVFKPVSFWYCHRADGSLAAVLAEVNNTFGERHCYLLAGAGLAFGREQAADKVFHVSPFCAPRGQYRFRFMRSADRIVARIAHDDDDGPLLQTSVSGRLEALTAASARAVVLGMPLMTLGIVARIHWQALRLWLKRVPLVRKPAPPASLVSR